MKKNNATTKKTSRKDAAIQAIATSLLDLETLETRRMDSLDFHELAVWEIRDALNAAFEAGRKASR